MQRMADDLPLSHYHVPPVSEFLFSVCVGGVRERV